jgi:uncharacterized RDD family membrane protein YckC
MLAGRAPLWRRVVAALLDRLIGLVLWGLGSLWLLIGLRLLRPGSPGLDAIAVQGAAILLLGLALHAVYHVGFVAGCGQTPGRMALGIAVTRRDGAAAGFGRAAVRALGGLCAALTLGLPNLVALFSRTSGSFGDWLAGTRVVRVGR